MAAPTETPVHDANPYAPPAISGLVDLLDHCRADTFSVRRVGMTGLARDII